MAEFRANGRDSPLDDEPERAPVIELLSRDSRPWLAPRCQLRDVLRSRYWRPDWTWPAARDTGATYGNGGAPCQTYGGVAVPSVPYRSACAPGGLHENVWSAGGPRGGVLVVDACRSGGGPSARSQRDERPSPPPRPPARPSRAASRRRAKQPNHCVFCRNNNELPCVYRSHVLKDDQGRISCPILRVYTCPMCGANGDVAHTVKYCPQRLPADQQLPAQQLPAQMVGPALRLVGRPITKRGR